MKIDQYMARYTGHTKMIYSDAGERTTVSSTRSDSNSAGVNHITFITDGALTSVTCTEGYIVNSTDISSATTYTAGSVIYLRDASKVKLTSHGAMMVHLNE